MGTGFFKNRGPNVSVNPSSGIEARALGTGAYAARGAGLAATKDLGAAMAINKAGAFKPMKRSAAYPKGPTI